MLNKPTLNLNALGLRLKANIFFCIVCSQIGTLHGYVCVVFVSVHTSLISWYCPSNA